MSSQSLHSPAAETKPLDPDADVSPSASAPAPESQDETETEEEELPTLSRGKKLLFTAIMLLITFGVLEFAAVVYLKVTRGYDGKHIYEFDFDPYKNISPAKNFVDTRGVRHNAQGFRRDTPVSRVKPAGTFRIFLMGGSAAYGTGGLWPHLQTKYAVLKNSETIDHYLERYLQQAMPGTKIEVINAAITSTWTHHHLIYLNQSLLKYDPDMVLFLDGFNDMYFTSPDHDQFGNYLYNTQASEILGDPTIGSLVAANGWWWYRKSALAHVSVKALRNGKLMLTAPRGEETRTPMNVDTAMAGLQKAFPENALKMHRRIGLILRDEGVTPVFMLQPMLVLERGHKPMSDVEKKLFDFNVTSYLPNYEPFIHRAVGFVRQEEAKMAAEVGGQFIDLTGIYAGVPTQIYTDYVHLTPEGNDILARYVGERILPTIRQKVAGPAVALPVQPMAGPSAAAQKQIASAGR